MKPARALQAAALQVTVTAVFTAAVVLIFASVRDQSMREALLEPPGTIGAMLRMVVGVTSAFIAGWWGVSGLSRRWIEQGLLIGVLVAAFGAVLALMEGEIETRTNYLLLLVVAAVAGSVVAASRPRIRRAFTAAAFQVLGTGALMILAFAVLAVSLTDTRGQIGATEAAMAQRYLSFLGVFLRLVTAFLAGWWGARGFSAKAVEQGLIIGVLIVVLSYAFTVMLARPLGFLDVLLLAPEVGLAIAGAVFERWRSPAGASS